MRKTVTTITCDFCGEQITSREWFSVVVTDMPEEVGDERYDCCPKCHDATIAGMKARKGEK